MSPADAADEAADLLWRHWQEGRVLEALPAAIRPATRAEGYLVQARLERRTTRPLFGWKIAATSTAGQQHIGVDGPLAGRLLAERAQPGGATVALGANRMRVAEPEFAFRIGRDLPPRAGAYREDEVLAAVASLHPAIELPDSRFADVTTAGAAQLIADDACADRFVLGAATGGDWRPLDLARHAVAASVAGQAACRGSGGNVLGDPRRALTWLANELSAHGLTLAAGQVVTTGTCMTPLPVVPGDAVVADFGALGSVEVRLTA
jgi:2-keto-4-pentenoate hydratase